MVDFCLFVRFVDHLPTSALRNCVPIHFRRMLLYLKQLYQNQLRMYDWFDLVRTKSVWHHPFVYSCISNFFWFEVAYIVKATRNRCVVINVSEVKLVFCVSNWNEKICYAIQKQSYYITTNIILSISSM